MLNIALYLQIFDISKYFDREILKNAMDTPYKCDITGKIPLAPMGALTHGSAHARPSPEAPIDTREHFSAQGGGGGTLGSQLLHVTLNFEPMCSYFRYFKSLF
jgi:hypothetical protein